MTVLARGAREIFSTLRYICALWIRANNALADGRKLDCIRPCQALLIIFALVLIGGCESDREELESSNSCVWCRLNDANLAGADLAGATLWMSFLERADLSEANLSGANINRAKLTAADLTGTNLANVDARKAVLIRAELTGADLSNADLSEAILENASFRSADLSGASLLIARMKQADFSGASLVSANIRQAIGPGVFLPGLISPAPILGGPCCPERTFARQILPGRIFQARIFLVQISPMLSGRIPAYVTLPVAMTEPIETDIKVSSRGDPN